jgi:hypothetical protein
MLDGGAQDVLSPLEPAELEPQEVGRRLRLEQELRWRDGATVAGRMCLLTPS